MAIVTRYKHNPKMNIGFLPYTSASLGKTKEPKNVPTKKDEPT